MTPRKLAKGYSDLFTKKKAVKAIKDNSMVSFKVLERRFVLEKKNWLISNYRAIASCILTKRSFPATSSQKTPFLKEKFEFNENLN